MPDRRTFLQSGAIVASSLLSLGHSSSVRAELSKESPVEAAPPAPHPILTPAESFRDVSRGNPKPHTLTGDALVEARLTPESWRLEVDVDPFTGETVKGPASAERQFRLEDNSAIDLPMLLKLGETCGVRYLKAMQCLNIPQPLGQGLWEGVPLREVLRLCGELHNVRRVYYSGYHNNDPDQLFQSSLSYSQVMEHAPGDPPVFLAYRINGEPISLKRGGPVRLIVPWAYGFKSIKWLQRISLTNDYRANDTYAAQNNDPDSPMKTAAYIDRLPEKFTAGRMVFLTGQVISGYSGLERLEYWLQKVEPGAVPIQFNDPVYRAAVWKPFEMEPEPVNWSDHLPDHVSPANILGFNKQTGRAKSWPLRYGSASWQIALNDLQPGAYEVRVRAVDLNGYAQPEPRPILKAGKNGVEVHRFEVVPE